MTDDKTPEQRIEECAVRIAGKLDYGRLGYLNGDSVARAVAEEIERLAKELRSPRTKPAQAPLFTTQSYEDIGRALAEFMRDYHEKATAESDESREEPRHPPAKTDGPVRSPPVQPETYPVTHRCMGCGTFLAAHQASAGTHQRWWIGGEDDYVIDKACGPVVPSPGTGLVCTKTGRTHADPDNGY